MLFDKRQQRKEEDVDLNSDNVSVFPLATPIIAGPAAITSVIVSVSDIGINFLYRNLDQLAWQYCNKGFFNFKSYIPKIISTFN